MIQLSVLSGKAAGFLWDARRFPVRVGRSPANDLCLEEDGVWEEHFQITLTPADGFHLTAHPGALVAVNQVAVENRRLSNGDVITAGSAKITFRIGDNRQTSLLVQESLLWALIAGVAVGQVAIVFWLLS